MSLPTSKPLWILIAGPYRSGTNDDPAKMAANVRAMTEVVLTLFRAGHVPIVGEWFALPLVEAGGLVFEGKPRGAYATLDEALRDLNDGIKRTSQERGLGLEIEDE